MSTRLISTSVRLDSTADVLVSDASNRLGGVQVGKAVLPDEACIPFGGGSALQDRKYVVITFPTDRVHVGLGTVPAATSYLSKGARRGDTYTVAPAVDIYSSRRQFLRGQYMLLTALPGITICANAIAVERVHSLETS